MKQKLLFIVLFIFSAWMCASAQSWPDYHLTEGTHTSSYGVVEYDLANQVKNLYIDPVAILVAGASEITGIYDGNQVFLNGGTIYASAIDEPDFTWNSGSLHLEQGDFSSTFGLATGSGKDLWLDSGAVMTRDSLNSIASGNRMFLNGGSLSVGGDLNAGMDGLYIGNDVTLEVGGIFEWNGAKEYGSNIFSRNLILNGPDASWNCGVQELGILNNGNNINSVSVQDGARMNGNAKLSGADVTITGNDSFWQADQVDIGDRSSFGQLTISDGGVVSNSGCLLGAGITGGENEILITGEGSQFVSLGEVSVGSSRSRNNKLSVQEGAHFSSTSLLLGGSDETGSNNKINITGAGSKMDISGKISLYGTGSSLKILNGAEVSSNDADIGAPSSFSSSRNSVEIKGPDSKWTSTGKLTIGGSDGNHVDISEGAELSVNGGISVNYGGTLNLDDSSILRSEGELSLDGGTFNMGSNTVVVKSDFKSNYGSQLNLSEGARLEVQGIIFDQGGEMNFEDATLSARTVINFSELKTGHRLETATVLGDIVVEGTLANLNEGGSFFASDTLTITADGTLEMSLGGYIQESQYDHLYVGGISELDGTLNILLDSGFAPTNGSSFILFDWNGGRDGTFENLNAPELSGGLSWDTTNLYTTGQLNVVPEPGTISLLGIGSGALLFARRRRRLENNPLPESNIKDAACDRFVPPAVEPPKLPCHNSLDLLDKMSLAIDQARSIALRPLDAFLARIMK